MQVVRAVIRGKGICLSVGVQLCILDAVTDAADGLAEEWGVVLLVEFLVWETLDDVGVGLADEEGLDDGSEGEEGKWCWGRHGRGIMVSKRSLYGGMWYI